MPKRYNMKNYSLGLYEKAMPDGLTFPEMLRMTRAAGFDRLEISIDETDARLGRLNWSGAEMSALVRAIGDEGVPIRTMCLSGHRKYPLGSHETVVRSRALEIMERAVDFSSRIGVAVIQMAGYDVYYESGDQDTELWFAENLQMCVEIAGKNGILLGFETMETPFMDTVEKAMRYVSRVNSPYLGVYPDVGNLMNAAVLYGGELGADLSRGAGHIYAAHLKETKPGIYRNMCFGEGHTDYARAISVLWDMGVRMFTGEMWYLGEAEPLSLLQRANAFLRDKIERTCKGD